MPTYKKPMKNLQKTTKANRKTYKTFIIRHRLFSEVLR